jgi:hypothetical protein
VGPRRQPWDRLTRTLEVAPAVLVLERDHEALQGPHHTDAEGGCERQPDDHVQPDRPAVPHLHDEGGGDDEGTGDERDEGHRSVAAVLLPEVRAADGAVVDDGKEAFKQAALAAGGAAGLEPGCQG